MKAQVLDIINALPVIGSDKMLLIGIDGCGGAGKSTLAEELAMERENVQVVHIDDFYKPSEERVEVTEITPVHINFEFDRLKQRVLKPLEDGRVATYQTVKGQTVEIEPRGYIIVEGLGALGTDLRSHFGFKIWIDALETVRRKRGIERDSEYWANIWDTEYLPQDARYVKEQQPQQAADIVIKNDNAN
ncbi:MAG: AAA family ATPase [Candidatus Saccharimonadales bacterium]